METTYQRSLTEAALIRRGCKSAAGAQVVASLLISESIWFVVIPMPDNVYEFCVKAEAKAKLDEYVEYWGTI